MIPRDFGPPTRTPREHLAPLGRSPTPEHVGFLFGSERFGMRNEDVYRCNVALSIPADPAFGSLNLGAAIQLIAYEWRLALGGFPVTESVAPPEAADARAVAGMLDHWERSLVEIGFLDPAAPKKLMPRLQQLFNRARPTVEEIHILRGIAKTMAQPQPQPQREAPAEPESPDDRGPEPASR
ncbi:MAG: RNA methyltransferase, partial [Variovorax sp.]